jgi:hypothetical protein
MSKPKTDYDKWLPKAEAIESPDNPLNAVRRRAQRGRRRGGVRRKVLGAERR